MPYSSFISSELANLATSLNQSVDGAIYLSKNGSVITAKSSENSSILLNMGFPYQFVNGESIYLQSGYISSPQQIPWLFNYTTLTASNSNLWNNSLTLWLDAKEQRSLNVTDQKIVSKDYTFNTPFVENTADFSFTYSANTIDLSNGSMLNSNSTTQVLQYFKLGMVITLPNQTGNGVIFQHDNIILRIAQNLAGDGSTRVMICLYDNATFKKGITFKPSDLTFKYYIYCDNSANLTVSGNSATQGGSSSFSYGIPKTIYIGQGLNGINSLIKVNEILYYQSSANDIVATNANINTYLTSRWALSTYADIHNIPPATWTNVYSRGDRRSIITVNTNFSLVGANGGTIQNWVDGSVASAQSWYYTGGQAVSGKYMGFTFAVAQKVTGFKIIPSGTDTPKTFDFQGSSNNSTWVSLGTFIYLDTASTVMVGNGQIVPDTDFVNDKGNPVPVDTHLVTNGTAYQYYRMFGVSGTTSGSPYEYEILFMIAS